MGESAAELRREIDNTRQHMTTTVDAIGDRVVPGRIMERRKNRWRASLASMRDSVMGTSHSVGDRMSSSSSSLTDSMRDRTETMREEMGEMRDEVAHLGDAALERTEGNPFAAGMVAFGLGMLAATVLPSSRAERRAADRVKDAAQPLMEEASEAAHDLVESAKEHGAEHVQAVRESGSEAAEHVTASAREHAQGGRSALRG
jgi:gas vesicle protein